MGSAKVRLDARARDRATDDAGRMPAPSRRKRKEKRRRRCPACFWITNRRSWEHLEVNP